MKNNRIFSAVMAGLLILSVAACSKKEATIATAYPDEKVGFQLEMPTKGEDEIAIMHTSMGDIKIRFFSEGAPKAVENFKTHSKNGYYNGLIFHRVFNDFMIQGGDPEGTGQGGESIYGANFEDEFDSKLLNLRGSLAMANSGPKTNGSQFFINQAGASKFPGRDSFDEETIKEQHKGYYEQNKLAFAQQKGITTFEEYFKAAVPYLSPDPKLVPEDVWKAYEKTGGNIHLDGAWRAEGGHTVFGQVFEGMDIVDKIAAVTADAEGKPTIDVKINTIEIIKYQG